MALHPEFPTSPFESRREIIKVPKGAGVNVVQGHLPGQEPDQRERELIAAAHTDAAPGRHTVAVKVIDIFGNDTMTLMPVTVG